MSGRILADQGIEFKIPRRDPDWELYSSTYNTRIPVKPLGVILPATAEEVVQAVRCVAGDGYKLQARSGGHSYASHSNGSGSAVVIDLRKLQDISLDADGIVRVGGGVRLGKLATAIFEQGKRALAHGTCPTVGIGGHFTHGAFGLTSRAWGLSIDQVVAMDVVLANGQMLKASESENPTLFMAMRGAADSFGIVVNFYLRTQPAPQTMINWQIDAPETMKSVESAVEAFLNIQKLVTDASVVDRQLGILAFLTHENFSLRGTYLGDVQTLKSTILPALRRAFPQHLQEEPKVSVWEIDWLSSLVLLADGRKLDVVLDNAERSCLYAKSAAIPRPGLSRDALQGYFQYLLHKGASAPVNYFVGVQLYGGADSQITANMVAAGVEFPEEGIRFMEGLHEALGSVYGASNNYADASLPPDKAQKMYYGEKLKLLMELKGAVDPEDVFSHPQSIRGAKPEAEE
ncbi:Glucooligosaccharide oxidase [Nemania sp. FL0916]|nr:Glucooligosaccharide oxidase [Nemania sp. FL0916]